MKKNIKEQFKESFLNIRFLIIFLALIGTLLWLFTKGKTATDHDLTLGSRIFTGIISIIIVYIIGFFRSLKLRNNADNVRSGKIKYKPYMIDKARFIEECKSGLIYSIVRIDGKIYELETQINKVKSPNFDKFICYINETQIIGLDNFLNYKYDGTHCLNELNNIEFLEFNETDPIVYFEDHKL